MSAEGQIKAFIDRILRLKEEQDVIGDDIRDIYAEAKGMGFDKTAMGNVVAHLRKVAKKGSETVAEQGAIFDIYLAAYEGHTPAPARVRENIEKFDPLTGEFLDDAPVTIIDQDDADGHHIKVTVDPQIAAILARVEAERSAAGLDIDGSVATKEHRSDGGLNIVTKHTEIASEGEQESPSTENVSPRDSGGSGANEGGEDVDRSAERAGLDGGPVNLEPSGPEAERATNSPEEANEPRRPAFAAASGGEPSIPSSDDGGAKMGGRSNDNPGRPDGTSVDHYTQSEQATNIDDDGIRYEATPPMPMKSLPYASCFPELSRAHYQQLSDSIANNGVREPIVRMGDVIVDGWSRYNISRSLGIEYPVVSYLGNDVLLDVIAWQREARQFTPSQERQIAARLAKEVPHRASEIMRAFQIEEELA